MDSKSPEQQEEHVSEETLQRAFLKLDSRGHGKFGPGELRAFLAKVHAVFVVHWLHR